MNKNKNKNKNKLKKIKLSKKILINNISKIKIFNTNKDLQKIIFSKKIQKMLINYVYPPIKRVFNVNTDRLDKSKLSYVIFKPRINLPPHLDLRNRFQPIQDQGTLGSCTANALAGIIGYIKPKLFSSRLFIYYNERVALHTTGQDSGALISDGIATLKRHGVCQENLWPYIDYTRNFKLLPPKKCYDKAMLNRVRSAAHIYNDLTVIKLCLLSKIPFILGFRLYESFNSAETARTGIVQMPNTDTETWLGGHAVVCVGYKDDTRHFIMRNSWGTSWGDNGYFYMPYEYLTNYTLTSNLWIITKFL